MGKIIPDSMNLSEDVQYEIQKIRQDRNDGQRNITGL